MSATDFESAARHVEPGHWASGESFLYHREMTDIPTWNVYGGSGFKRLTRAQQVLMCWNDVIGQVANGGLEQLHENFAHAMAEIVGAVREIGWTELTERFHEAHIAYIAPSETVEQWRTHRKMKAELDRKRLLKAWRDNIATYDPLPIWLFDFWRSHGQGLFNSEKARKAWRNHYRNRPPDEHMLWVFAAQVGVVARDRLGEEVDFNNWFYSAEAKAASALHIERYIRANRDELVMVV